MSQTIRKKIEELLEKEGYEIVSSNINKEGFVGIKFKKKKNETGNT